MKENEKMINVEAHELSVRDEHLAVIENLPEGFVRVDFDNPNSIMNYGHDDKEAISDILVSTAGLSVKQGRLALSDDMIKKIYSFDEELDESDKKSSKKELGFIRGIKSGLTRLGVKKFEREKEMNSYSARYKAYCDNISEVCSYVDEQMQQSMDDINLRREIAYEMKPYLEHLQMTIKAGEADYFLYVEETKKMKESPNSEELADEIRERELIAHAFNDKLDKLRKVFTSYKQQLLVYAEQQHNEMILVGQQQSYIEDQQPILRAQGSSMIFNRQQQQRASDLDRLNEATNRAYQENAMAIVENTEKIADLAVTGGLKTESIQALQSAIERSIQIVKDTQARLEERIASDEAVLEQVNKTSDEYEHELEGINQLLEGLDRNKMRGKGYAKHF